MTTLVIFAGQSNALGFGNSLSTLPAGLAHPNPTAYIFTAGGAYWGGLEPGVNTGTAANPQAWGPEAEFAYRFGLDHPGEILLIVKSAKGSTGLASDANALDWSPTSHGELFDITDATVDQARAAFTSATGLAAPLPSATFWMQGEADATDPAKASSYQAHLHDLDAAIRTRWMDNASGHIGVGRITDTAAEPYNADVRVAQWAEDQADPLMDSFKTIGFGLQADAIHYNAAGQVALGDGFYGVWDGWF